MTATRDGEALMAAILADPADDFPRLAYADWCDESGDPDRAEFIRLGVANQGRQPHNTFGPVGLREEELIGNRLGNFQRWLGGLPALFGLKRPYGDFGYCGNGETVWSWERGFVSGLQCLLGEWLHGGAAALKIQPIQYVECSDRMPAVREYGGGDERYLWYRGPGGFIDSRGCMLPPNVWKAMCPDAEDDCRFVEFGTADEADKALSDTLIRMARGAIR
jgi:uncharacterized protein (TIGR02996 family)